MRDVEPSGWDVWGIYLFVANANKVTPGAAAVTPFTAADIQ
jgi:hypothetical protein